MAPAPFTSVSALAGWGLLALAGGAWMAGLRGPGMRGRLIWTGWFLLGAALVCFRWPLIWLPHDLYPDESQLIAGAITLRHDPLFWRAVDVGTAGPLDCYVLLPAAFFPGVTAYAVARLIGAALLWGTLVAVGEILAVTTRCASARLAAVPALFFAAFTTSPEYLHCSTELLACFLVAGGAWAYARHVDGPSRVRLVLAGLLLGAVPWAKLQLVPVAGVMGLFFVVHEFRTGRRASVAPLIASAFLPTLLVLLVLAATGLTDNMVGPYLEQNLLYAQTGRQALALVARQQWDQALTNGYLAAWLMGAALFGIIAAVGTGREGFARLRGPAGLALAWLAIAVVCILTPGRPYPHYLILLLAPVTLVIGIAWAAWRPETTALASRKARLGLACFGVLLVLPPLALRFSGRPDPYADYNYGVTAPSAGHHRLIARIKSLARPGESLGLWGWRSSLYVETGLYQATRQATTLGLLITAPRQNYFLQTYYESLVAAAPPVFVDAAGPGNFYFSRRQMGHELFTPVRDWVQANYTLVDEQDGVRVYARNDRARATAR